MCSPEKELQGVGVVRNHSLGGWPSPNPSLQFFSKDFWAHTCAPSNFFFKPVNPRFELLSCHEGASHLNHHTTKLAPSSFLITVACIVGGVQLTFKWTKEKSKIRGVLPDLSGLGYRLWSPSTLKF